MLERILTAPQHALVRRERRALAELQALLARLEAGTADQSALAESVAQLDELFLLVVVGEFNAGKSAVLNVLLGTELLAEGVTPTTSAIHLIRFGESAARERRSDGVELVSAPVPLLRELNFVDTPGTNAIDRRHEALTEEFVPRSDLVLFVTSADRPFSESERAFLAKLRAWGKKVVVVLNKVDILEDAGEVASITRFIADNCERLLGFVPEIFPLSARRARRRQKATAEGGDDDSGLTPLTDYLHATLDAGARVRLKLLNPLRVGRRLQQQYAARADERGELLQEDLRTLAELDQQQALYREDMEREFRFRLGGVDKLLHEIENRGMAFFDDTLRLVRLVDLLNRSRVELEFSRRVIAEAPAAIEAQVDDIIEWMLTSETRQWQAIVEHTRKRHTAHGHRVIGELGAGFAADRRALLDSVGRAAQRAVETYDHQQEASRLAESVRSAVAGAALLEASAVGLGAVITVVASTTAVDVTGILAAGTLATLGLFVIPTRRRQAKAALRERLAELRQQLMTGISQQFASEIERSLHRIGEAIAPYTRFVRAERETVERDRAELASCGGELEQLEHEIDRSLPGDD